MYAVSFITALLAVFIFLFKDTLFPSPTCFDTKQNGFELGVDCGGVCSLKCTQEVNPLSVVWAKAVPAGKGLYDLVALVSNTNINNASHELKYTFTLYDEKGISMGIFEGSTVPPLDGKFPLIAQNIALKKAPTTVSATLLDGAHYTVTESPTSPTVVITDRRYEAGDIPRLYATVVNTKHLEINNLPVRALLYDIKDNVYAVGQTVIPVLPKEGVQTITFTWNQNLSVPPTRVEIFPIFNPFDAISY